MLAGFMAGLCMLAYGVFAAAGGLSAADAPSRPDFTLRDLQGRDHALGDFEGRVVLVSFWASWCMPCVEEMPGLLRLAARMQGRPVSILAINVAESPLRVKAAVKRLGITVPVLLDRDSSVFDAWGATVLPSSYLLDSHGRVRLVWRGVIDWDSAEVIDVLDRLLTTGGAETQASHP